MKKNIQKSNVEIIIQNGISFEYTLPDSYLKFNEDFFKKGYPLTEGELSYINSNNQKIIVKSKNDFISLLRFSRSVPYKLKIFYDKKILDSYINDFEFINIENVYSDLDLDDNNNDLIQINQLDIIEEKENENNIYKGGLFQGIQIITNLIKKKYFVKIIKNIDSEDILNYNKKIDFKNIPCNRIFESIKLEYKLPSIDTLLDNFKIDFTENDNIFDKNEDILNELSSHLEKIDDNINNNLIFQTMLNTSKISGVKNIENKNEIQNNDNNINKIYQTDMVESPLIEHFGVECKKCHIKPIKNKRYKCPKCINYNLCENCEENNAINSFHPHKEFILIRIHENNFSDNPYSYQCLTKNLVFNIKKEEIKNDEIIIKNILLKNNFILPWPGGKNTFLKCDRALSTIFCQKIFLPNLVLGNTVNINFIFKKANIIPKGEYKCITNFFVNGEKYGESLEIFINIK